MIGISLEIIHIRKELMLRLKLQHFGHLMQNTDSLEKTLMVGKIESRRRRGWQRTRWLDGIINSMEWDWANSGRWWRTRKLNVLQFLGSQRVRHNLVTEQKQQVEAATICGHRLKWMPFRKLSMSFGKRQRSTRLGGHVVKWNFPFSRKDLFL